MTMDATNFAYWLNGFAELNGDTPPTAEQWKAIREHLAEALGCEYRPERVVMSGEDYAKYAADMERQWIEQNKANEAYIDLSPDCKR